MTFSSKAAGLEARLQTLNRHTVFSAIGGMAALRLFMSWHVFAVWDFMCLVKRLQRDLTSTGPVWLPPATPLAARLLNEIVLGEESDELPGGGYASHFELYLLAMREVGADTAQVETFTTLLRQDVPASEALVKAGVPPAVRDFVNATLRTVTDGNLYEVLGSFFYGREHVIPAMFGTLLENWGIGEEEAPMFVYYLKRHIELDGESHGPAAARIIRRITHDDQDALQQLNAAAARAIDDRIALWDGLVRTLHRDHAYQREQTGSL